MGAVTGAAAGGAIAVTGTAAAAVVCGAGFVGGTVGHITGHRLRTECEKRISKEAQESDSSFTEAQRKPVRKVLGEAFSSGTLGCLDGGLAKLFRRTVVPKNVPGESALKYQVKKQLAENSVKVTATVIPKQIQNESVSVSDLASDVAWQTASSAAGGLAERAVKKSDL